MSKLNELANVGQSVWLDFISRNLIKSGELKNLINDGLRGMTSNPTIFDKAIANSSDYDEDINAVAKAGLSIEDVYEKLALTDIGLAADRSEERRCRERV